MKALQFKIQIQARKEKVWNALWQDDNYKQWTQVFCPGSYYQCEKFQQGNRIHFLTPQGEGMYSDIALLKEFEVLCFRHIGELKNFQEQELTEFTQSWTNAEEKYELNELNSDTIVTVTVDTVDEYIEYMNAHFPKALQELKKISEKE